MSETPPIREFDRLWNFGDPAGTEAKLRELIPAAEAESPSLLAELLTQVARAQGLQRKFDEAHATLDGVEPMLAEISARSWVRYMLERGRVFNSSGNPAEAYAPFLAAWDLAREAGEDSLAVDAAHMLGIIERPDEALKWNETAIAYAEQSSSEKAKRWLGPLYNNTGWTYFDGGDPARALEIFEKARAWFEQYGGPQQIQIAKWTVARTHRALGRVEEALQAQQVLLREREASGEPDGYVFEELGECLLALGRPTEAAPYFRQAHTLLSQDPWLAEKEPERIARLAQLGG